MRLRFIEPRLAGHAKEHARMSDRSRVMLAHNSGLKKGKSLTCGPHLLATGGAGPARQSKKKERQTCLPLGGPA